ncbi:hypothetical protein ZYGNAAKF_CDS0201 [Enterococcus phage VRE9_2]
MLEKEMQEKINEMKKEVERTEKRLMNHHLLITTLHKDFAEYIKEQLKEGFYDNDIITASKNALDVFFSTQKTLDIKNHRIYKNSFELIYLEQAEQIRRDVFVAKILRR